MKAFRLIVETCFDDNLFGCCQPQLFLWLKMCTSSWSLSCVRSLPDLFHHLSCNDCIWSSQFQSRDVTVERLSASTSRRLGLIFLFFCSGPASLECVCRWAGAGSGSKRQGWFPAGCECPWNRNNLDGLLLRPWIPYGLQEQPSLLQILGGCLACKTSSRWVVQCSQCNCRIQQPGGVDHGREARTKPLQTPHSPPLQCSLLLCSPASLRSFPLLVLSFLLFVGPLLMGTIN